MGNAEKVHLMLLLCSLIWKCTRLRPQQILTNSKGQCHLVIFTKGHLFVVCQYVRKTSSLKLLDRFLLVFICRFLVKAKERRIYLVQITLPRCPPFPYKVEA